MARFCAIKNPKGDYSHFKKKAADSRDAFMQRKPFEHDWDCYRARGYQIVKVDIRDLEVVS